MRCSGLATRAAGTPADRTASSAASAGPRRRPVGDERLELAAVLEAAARSSRTAGRGGPSAIRAARRDPVVVVAARDRDPRVVTGRRDRCRGEPSAEALSAFVSSVPAVRTGRSFTIASSSPGPARLNPASVHDMSIAVPRPVRLRCTSAARIAKAMKFAAHVVHVGVAVPGRFLAGEPGVEREAGHGLDDRSERLVPAVRAGGAEAAVGDVDHLVVDLPQALVAEAESFHDPGREVLGHHVGAGDEAEEELLARVGPEVQRRPELLDVVVVEHAAEVDAAPLVDVGRGAADDVPAALVGRILDPDHLGAERGQDPGGARTGEDAAQVADADRPAARWTSVGGCPPGRPG